MKAAVLDYGMGNIHSAAKALERAGFAVRLVGRAGDLDGDICVVPGVGHFQRCMEALRGASLDGPTVDWSACGRPVLGICVGAQMLFEGSDEAPGVDGLGVLEGRVTRLEADRLPHMGWNHVDPGPAGGQLITERQRYYFVHSYGLQPRDPSAVAGWCDYGAGFAAVVAADHVIATQFHPEKSGAAGLALLSRLRDLV